MTKNVGIHLMLVFCFYQVMNIPFSVCLIFQTWRCSFCWNSN